MRQENEKATGDKVTKFFVNDGLGIVEKFIPAEEATELYKSNLTNTYPPVFYHNTMKCRGWQVATGECIGKLYNIQSAVDFGCGLGYYLEGLKKSGTSKIRGFEVSYENAKDYISKEVINNVSQGNVMTEIDCGIFDLSMSIEVAEHILPEKSEIFIDNMVKASNKYIVLTAAPPGQGGVCHINERPTEYWKKLLGDRGFYLSQEDVNIIRSKLNILPHGGKYFSLIKRQIMFFRRAK
jgi:hypothetical protein